MQTKKIFRDGVWEDIKGRIRVHTTSDGHVVESYRLKSGERRFFATIAGTTFCAHGDSVAAAISDALWKDEKRRPSLEDLKASIQKEGTEHKFTLGEFRLLTGACLTGCRTALIQAKQKEKPMAAFEIRDKISKEWGNKLISILGWQDVKR